MLKYIKKHNIYVIEIIIYKLHNLKVNLYDLPKNTKLIITKMKYTYIPNKNNTNKC